MENYPKYLDPQTLAKLQGLELRARLIVEGYVSGVHRSPYHGFSIEFAEHREYVPGDDLRYVDWKVFGKTDKFYLKQYEEETNLVCYLLLGHQREHALPQRRGADVEARICPVPRRRRWPTWSCSSRTASGLATFDREIRALVRPSSNPSHLKQLLHVMEDSAGRAKDVDRADLPRPGRAAQEAGHRGDPQRPVRRRGLDDGRAEALPPSPARGGAVPRARPGRAGFPFPATRRCSSGLEHLPEVLVEPRALRKAYLREFDELPPAIEARLPAAPHRLRRDADRPAAGRGAVELPGIANDEIPRGLAVSGPSRAVSARMCVPQAWASCFREFAERFARNESQQSVDYGDIITHGEMPERRTTPLRADTARLGFL